jgi:signal transduction histidine kinase
LHFESLARKLNVSSPALKEDVTRIRREIEDYVRETRQSVWALRAPDQVRFDLPTMLKRTGERCTAGSSVRFDFTFNGAPREWPHRVEQQLLRIGQEAIHNSVRHANASYVRVWLEDKDQELCLRVSDDGCGFDLTGEQLEDHCGLRGMRERAAQVGGQLRIVAERGKGTEIEVAVPLSPSH